MVEVRVAVQADLVAARRDLREHVRSGAHPLTEHEERGAQAGGGEPLEHDAGSTPRQGRRRT